jgi:hypothetical protein
MGIVANDAMPQQTVKPFPGGANNIYSAGVVEANNQNALQNALINPSSGGKKRKYRFKGGAAEVLVPPVPSYAPGSSQATTNNTALTSLALKTQNGAAYDNTVNSSPAEVASISAQQNSVYYGSGGSIKKKSISKSKYKKGGSWPKWGCLSGGKKTRRNKKKHMSKRRKTKRHQKNA